MGSKLIRSHTKLLDSAIAELSKAHDIGDSTKIVRLQMDIVVTATILEQWNSLEIKKGN